MPRCSEFFFPVFLLLLLRLRLAPRTRPVGNSIKRGRGRGGETRAQIDGGRSTAAAASPSPAGGFSGRTALGPRVLRVRNNNNAVRVGSAVTMPSNIIYITRNTINYYNNTPLPRCVHRVRRVTTAPQTARRPTTTPYKIIIYIFLSDVGKVLLQPFSLAMRRATTTLWLVFSFFPFWPPLQILKSCWRFVKLTQVLFKTLT